MQFWPKNLGSLTETASPPGCEGNLETACPTSKIHTLETEIKTLETANPPGCQGKLETAFPTSKIHTLETAIKNIRNSKSTWLPGQPGNSLSN